MTGTQMTSPRLLRTYSKTQKEKEKEFLKKRKATPQISGFGTKLFELGSVN